MSRATANGQRIEYDVHGAGEPVLLIMGLGSQLVVWPLEFVERLADRRFQVIRFDNRDVGLSSKFAAPPPAMWRFVLAALSPRTARSPYHLSDMAEDAAGLLDHLGIERAHVVGVSLGGMMAQCLAIQHPDRVTSLTSVMANTGDRRHGRPRRSLLLPIGWMMLRHPETTPANAVEAERMVSGPKFDAVRTLAAAEESLARDPEPDAGTMRQTMAMWASPDRTRDLGSLRMPTLVIHGMLDPIVTPSGGVATARAVPGARLISYPEMGHDVPDDRWDEIIDEIVQNIRRALPPGDAVTRPDEPAPLVPRDRHDVEVAAVHGREPWWRA